MVRNNIISSSFLGSRLTSIISSSLVLFLLGVLVILSLMTKQLSAYVKENIGFSVILTDRASDSELKQLSKQLSAARYTRSSEVFTKQRALKELAEELGENPRNFLGSVPLMASIDVKLKAEYANNDSIQLIEQELRTNKAVREVLCRKDLIQMVNDNLNRIGMVLLIVVALFMSISFVVMSNTIRLHIYSKRFILQTMKLVGASHGFIRKPFMLSNIYNGIIAAGISIGLLSGVLYYLSTEIEGFSSLITPDTLLIAFGVVLTSGIVLSVTFTYFALTRFLRMKREKLYNV